MTDMSTGPMVDCPVCNETLLPGDETDCAGNPLKTYEVVTVVKTTDMTRGTIVGELNFINFWNAFRTEVGTDDAGDVVANLQDCSWVYLKVANLF